MSHTPGPWHASPYGEEWAVDGIPDETSGPFGPQICDRIDAEDDARLIAAAPELLEKLIDADEIVHGEFDQPGDNRASCRFCKVIAKATGEQP